MALCLLAFWVALNGRITWEIVLIGVGIAALALLFACKMCDWSLKKEMGLYRALPRLLGFLLTVLWEILKANMRMLRIVYGGKPSPVVRTVPTGLKTRFARMLLCNAITLTPGTITLECRDGQVTVHCLAQDLARGLEDTVFERKLMKIEEALHG